MFLKESAVRYSELVMVSPVCPLGRVSEVLTHGTAGAGEGGDELTEGLERSLTHL